MNKQVMRLTVAAKSKFGILNGNDGKWYNPKEKDMLSQFNVDASYDVELEENKGKDGKTYLNIVSAKRASVASTVPVTPSQTAHEAIVSQAGVFAKQLGGINKDERILVQGLTQALLQSPVMQTVETKDLMTFVESTVVKLVEMTKRLSA